MSIDSSDQMFQEVPIPDGQVRVTYIENGWDDSPSVRIQIRDENGHLRQGPEIPITSIAGVVGAVVNLISN
ncbi:MAG: hypothetical protein HF978_06025 [Desulfobacteraceae bacterium]|nr:hypothetical protein [Desulfobacteraceae bacterium]MBC2755091.1 hypothetical protein [Desulfobacteraceae bacterium]